MAPVPVDMLPAFALVSDVDPIRRSGEHGGRGPITFRRLLQADAFAAPVDFVDVTVIAPGSTIGLHRHAASEELYIVLAGEPLVDVNGDARRLSAGDVAVVHPGGSHSLVNDTPNEVTIAVVQLRVTGR